MPRKSQPPPTSAPPVPPGRIKHLDGWLTMYEVGQCLGLAKQSIHWLVFESGYFDIDEDVCALRFSAAQFVYCIRESAVEAERKRREAVEAQKKRREAKVRKPQEEMS